METLNKLFYEFCIGYIQSTFQYKHCYFIGFKISGLDLTM